MDRSFHYQHKGAILLQLYNVGDSVQVMYKLTCLTLSRHSLLSNWNVLAITLKLRPEL